MALLLPWAMAISRTQPRIGPGPSDMRLTNAETACPCPSVTVDETHRQFRAEHAGRRCGSDSAGSVGTSRDLDPYRQHGARGAACARTDYPAGRIAPLTIRTLAVTACIDNEWFAIAELRCQRGVHRVCISRRFLGRIEIGYVQCEAFRLAQTRSVEPSRHGSRGNPMCVSTVEIDVRNRCVEMKSRDRITQQVESLVALAISLEAIELRGRIRLDDDNRPAIAQAARERIYPDPISRGIAHAARRCPSAVAMRNVVGDQDGFAVGSMRLVDEALDRLKHVAAPVAEPARRGYAGNRLCNALRARVRLMRSHPHCGTRVGINIKPCVRTRLGNTQKKQHCNNKRVFDEHVQVTSVRRLGGAFLRSVAINQSQKTPGSKSFNHAELHTAYRCAGVGDRQSRYVDAAKGECSVAAILQIGGGEIQQQGTRQRVFERDAELVCVVALAAAIARMRIAQRRARQRRDGPRG